MAISSNGLGKFSGKLGGAVFVIRNGKQIVREYNPRPSNPKSALQLPQRAKGNLTGRISSMVPKAAIFGLGTNAIRRRSQFNKILLDAAQVTVVNDEYIAKVPWQLITFSRGSVAPVMTFSTAGVSGGGTIISVDLTGFATSVVPADIYAASNSRLVVMIYDNATQNLVEVATKVATKPNQGSTAATDIQIATKQAYIAALYMVPFSTADGSAASISTSMASKDDAAIAASLSINDAAVVFNYGNSIFLGQISFTPSTISTEKQQRK